MAEFNNYGRRNEIDFGDYVKIQEYSDGRKFIYKVVKAFESNCWCETPLGWYENKEQRHHSEMRPVLNVIKCGIDETEVIRVLESDCELIEA